MNMQEFIDQKKEMFHAQLAYSNVEQEIQLLSQKQKERTAALQKSKQELEDDHTALMNFIAQDTRESAQKERDLKMKEAEKNSKEETVKKLDAEIAAVEAAIVKDRDALNELRENKRFLLELAPAEVSEARLAKEEQKKQEAFRQWIEKFYHDESQDDVIFGEDPEIHGDIKLSSIPEEYLHKSTVVNQ